MSLFLYHCCILLEIKLTTITTLTCRHNTNVKHVVESCDAEQLRIHGIHYNKIYSAIVHVDKSIRLAPVKPQLMCSIKGRNGMMALSVWFAACYLPMIANFIAYDSTGMIQQLQQIKPNKIMCIFCGVYSICPEWPNKTSTAFIISLIPIYQAID